MAKDNFIERGAELFTDALAGRELALLESVVGEQQVTGPGLRLRDNDSLGRLLEAGSALDRIAREKLGDRARAVRAVFFDKSAKTNWALGWHQDRTIIVRERRDVPGFGPWTEKSGLIHVEPPYELISQMITVRAHLDAVDPENAPLLVAPGSHRLGRIPV